MKVTLTRKNKAFHFEAINEADLILNIDGSIDLLLILKKQRQAVEDIKIEATAERSIEAAKEFKKIHLHYSVEGEVATDKMEHAIDLAINKYCSAIQSLSPAIEITTSFKIN